MSSTISPRLSIIVPVNRNYLSVQKLLDNLQKQNAHSNLFEVIITDSKFNKNESQKLQKKVNELPTWFRYFPFPEGHFESPSSYGWWLGIKKMHPRNEFVTFASPHIIYKDDSLKKIVDHMNNSKAAMMHFFAKKDEIIFNKKQYLLDTILYKKVFRKQILQKIKNHHLGHHLDLYIMTHTLSSENHFSQLNEKVIDEDKTVNSQKKHNINWVTDYYKTFYLYSKVVFAKFGKDIDSQLFTKIVNKYVWLLKLAKACNLFTRKELFQNFLAIKPYFKSSKEFDILKNKFYSDTSFFKIVLKNRQLKKQINYSDFSDNDNS